MKKVRKEEYHTTDWSGGKTTELWIFPLEATYQKRDFQYRISTASVVSERSEFTKLPGVERKLMVLNGDIQIQHNQEEWITLPCFEEHRFMGDWCTNSIGQCVDFNLMLKDGMDGNIAIITETGKYQYDAEHLFIYVYQGSASVSQISEEWRKTEESVAQTEYLAESEAVYLEAVSDTICVQVNQQLPETICIVCTMKSK